MNEKGHEWMEEQKRVDTVIAKVKKKRTDLDVESQMVQKEIVDIRRNFWDDVTVNLDDATEAAETAASMRQQAEVLSERERRYQHADQQVQLLKKMEYSPYFGRIDFQELGEKKAEKIYLGVGSFYDEEKEEFLIYDWRAPISSLYYDSSPGPAMYRTPLGMIEGRLERKRQFVIKNGIIEGLFDTGVTIGDELLKEVLGKQADAQMKSIVATIQREQNQIIRDDRSPLIIVQGVAGSGKTSAVMQRIAYLLYRHRGHLRPDQMILFSPNPMFNSYVSTVLPELGEENIIQTTFQEYLEKNLGKTYMLEDLYDQMESILNHQPNWEIRRAGIRFKSSQTFFDLLETYIRQLLNEGIVFQNIRFRGEIYLSAQEIESYFYGLKDIEKIPNRLEETKKWILHKLAEREKDERNKPWVNDAIENLDEEVYNRIFHQLQKKRRFTEETFDDFDRERHALARYVINKSFAPLKKKIKRLEFLDLQSIYKRIFQQKKETIKHWFPTITLPDEWDQIRHQTLEKIKSKGLFYEDTTPFVYLKERLEGFDANFTIRHVLIDEAQDYSPFQFAVLQQLFPRSKMTVLGDVNQSIYPHIATNQDPFLPLHTLFPANGIKRYHLHKSYRSTLEIMTFARQLLNNGKEIVPFERHGKKPTLFIYHQDEERLKAIAKQVNRLQSEGNQTIAILCKTELESNDLYQKMTHLHNIEAQRLHKHSISYQQGVVVLPAYLAKGIEFDVVLIADTSNYQHEWERKLFYTACTRAMHELYLFAKDNTNPFLREVSSASYNIQS